MTLTIPQMILGFQGFNSDVLGRKLPSVKTDFLLFILTQRMVHPMHRDPSWVRICSSSPGYTTTLPILDGPLTEACCWLRAQADAFPLTPIPGYTGADLPFVSLMSLARSDRSARTTRTNETEIWPVGADSKFCVI